MPLRRTKPAAQPEPSSPSSVGTADDSAGGKGRPTPKRKDAEAARRRPVYIPPADRKARRDQLKASRAADRAAFLAGDERALPPRDRGPVRRFVRDYIDGRRLLSEWFLPIGVPLYLILAFTGGLNGQSLASTAVFVLILFIIGEMVFTALRLRRELAAAFPGESTRGAVFYGITRGAQVRRWRLPKPQVKPGQRPGQPEK